MSLQSVSKKKNAALGHNLAEDNTGHYRIVREVALKEKLISTDVEPAFHVLVINLFR